MASIVIANVAVAPLPTLLLGVMVAENAPAAVGVGVPVIAPVEVFKERPVGRDPAVIAKAQDVPPLQL